MARVLHDSDCSETRDPTTRNNSVSYQVVLEATDTSDVSDDSNESTWSLQAETTVSAKDSSDLSSEYISEFELATTPEMWPPPWSFSSTENSPQQVHMIEIEEEVTGSETWETWETSPGDSNYDSDSYGSHHRFPRCIMCSATNENDYFHFCNSCYKLKKEVFPDKPKGRKRKCPNVKKNGLKNKIKVGSLRETSLSLDSQRKNYTHVESNRSNTDSQLSDNISAVSVTNESSEVVSSYTVDSGVDTNNSQEWNIDSQKEKCLTCLDKDASALFLHGKTGHRCCCYMCAKRIWSETRRCPICRNKVSNIIKILNC